MVYLMMEEKNRIRAKIRKGKSLTSLMLRIRKAIGSRRKSTLVLFARICEFELAKISVANSQVAEDLVVI